MNNLTKYNDNNLTTYKLDINNYSTILNFGKDITDKFKSILDTISNRIKDVSEKEKYEIIDKLNNIVKKMDIEDFEKEVKPTLINKLFNRVGREVDFLVKKYTNISNDLDKVEIILNTYLNNIFNDTKELEKLNLQCYEFFEKLENSIQYGQEFSSSIDESIYDNKVYKELLDKRILELKQLQTVFLHKTNTLSLEIRNNFYLHNIINSKMITTLPILKLSIIEAISLKRTRIYANRMRKLDNFTHKVMEKNNENIIKSSKEILNDDYMLNINKLKENFEVLKSSLSEIENIRLEKNREVFENTQQIDELIDKYKKFNESRKKSLQTKEVEREELIKNNDVNNIDKNIDINNDDKDNNTKYDTIEFDSFKSIIDLLLNVNSCVGSFYSFKAKNKDDIYRITDRVAKVTDKALYINLNGYLDQFLENKNVYKRKLVYDDYRNLIVNMLNEYNFNDINEIYNIINYYTRDLKLEDLHLVMCLFLFHCDRFGIRNRYNKKQLIVFYYSDNLYTYIDFKIIKILFHILGELNTSILLVSDKEEVFKTKSDTSFSLKN